MDNVVLISVNKTFLQKCWVHWQILW